MTLKIEIDPETEQSLHQIAAEKGVDAESLVAGLLGEHLTLWKPDPHEEIKLLTAINEGWPESLWLRYRDLVQQRDDRTISDNDLSELIDLTSKLEGINAKRITLLARLAELRGISLLDLMNELGISPREV